jgi:uncharacterized UPF0146 family protein
MRFLDTTIVAAAEVSSVAEVDSAAAVAVAAALVDSAVEVLVVEVQEVLGKIEFYFHLK